MGREEAEKRAHFYSTSLYYLAKLYGLAPFSLKNGKVYPGNWWDTMYSVALMVLGVSGLVLTCLTIKEDLQIQGVVYASIPQSVGGLGYCSTEIAYVMYFLLKWKVVGEVIDQLSNIDRVLAKLRASKDYPNPLEGCFFAVTLYTLIPSIFQIYHVLRLWHVQTQDWERLFARTCISVLVMSVHRAVVMSFVVVLYVLGNILQRASYILLNVCGPVLPGDLHIDAGDDQEKNFKSDAAKILRDRPQLFVDYLLIGKLQSNISDVTEKVAALFGFPLLGIIVLDATTLVRYCSHVYQVLFGATYDSAEDATKSTFGFLYMFWVGVLVNEFYWITAASANIRDKSLMFAMQLDHTPLNISPYGIASLDFSFLHKIFWTTMTYTVVVIQLQKKKTDSERGDRIQ